MVQRSGVLIETYWNVKMDDLFLDMYYFFVLIETYWNVKTKSYSQLTLDGRSINRNILECKGRKEKATGAAEKVLIETYWNVKYDMKKISGSEFLY